MKRAFPLSLPLSFVSLALGVLLLGAAHRPRVTHAALVPTRISDVSAGSIARALAIVAPTIITAKIDDDRPDTRRLLQERAPGTYIDDILRERDSALARWPDRHELPLAVWIQPRSAVRDFLPGYVERVRTAFEEWDALDLPVRFRFVADSADADVHVNWVDHFDQPISGRTRWTRDDDWVITDANILLAVHHHQGEQLDEDSMRAMALHEIGHLLGLDHTTDSLSIMAPTVRVRQLSNADKATVKLVYSLPAGVVK